MECCGRRKTDVQTPVLHKFLCCMMPVITSTNTQGHSDPGLQRLLSSLDQLQSKVNGTELDLAFLRSLFQSTDFQSLIKVHQKVTTPETQEQKALAENATDLANEVYEEVYIRSSTTESQELLSLLTDPHIKALLEAHDRVANKDFLPKLPDIPHEVDEDEESVKIVQLIKSNEPLGATIKRNDSTGSIQIARVMHGGAADRSGLIHAGDEVFEVNGVEVQGREPDEIVQILSNSVGPITLKLVPSDSDLCLYRESKMRVKAHFSYDPQTDPIIPCKEAGLAFKKGDILHIVSQDDPNWWQARKEGDRNMRAGLIPGKQLQERKEALKASTANLDSKALKEQNKAKFSPKLGKKCKKTRKIMYHAHHNDEYDAEEIITYEEVEKLYPKSGLYRPLVLIGPRGVGRNELKKRLIASNTNHFKSVVPYTTRPKKPTEVEGEEFMFVTQQEMDQGIQNQRFVESVECQGHMYGTSYQAIKSVINEGKVCVLCPNPQALKLLRTAEVKPFTVFIKPPSLERLRETRTTTNATSVFDENNSRPFTDEEFNEMIHSAAKIEASYSHYLDQTVVNEDLNRAVNELSLIVHRLETDPQWLPASWVR